MHVCVSACVRELSSAGGGGVWMEPVVCSGYGQAVRVSEAGKGGGGGEG